MTKQVDGAPLEKRWHFLPWRLEEIKPEQMEQAFTLMFHDQKYIKLREQRTALYNKVLELQEDPKVTPSRLRAALNAIIEKDKEIAQVMLQSLAVYSSENGGAELMTMDDLRDSFEELTEEQEQCMIQLATIHRRIGFKVDSIEWDIIDLCDEMHKLRPDLNYTGADGVRIALEQLRTFIGDTNIQVQTEEEKMLYADYADSISAYINMRIKTFMQKLADMKNKQIKAQQKQKTDAQQKHVL